MKQMLLWLTAVLLLPHAGGSPVQAQGLFEDAVAGGGETREAAPADGAEPANKAPGPCADSSGLCARAGGIDFELNGYIRGALYLGKLPDEASLQTKSGYGETSLKLQARKGKWGDAVGDLRLRAGHEGGETDGTVELREAHVNLYLGPVDLRMGHQVIVWGRADAVNPTNNLTPRDMRVRSPHEDDARLANLALRGQLSLDPLRWEVVWVPFYAPSHFPDFNMAAAAGLPIKVNFGEPDYPDTDVRNSILATRVHLLLPAVEASVSYLIGPSTFPGIALASINPTTPLSATLAFATYRHQVVGADFATTIGAFGLRGEFAFRSPFGREGHEHVPMPDLQYVVGLDHELLGELAIIAQYSGRVVLEFEELDTSAMFVDMGGGRSVPWQLLEKNRMIAGQLYQVQHSATLRLAWTALQEALKLELVGMVNFTTEELMLRPKVSYDIADALKVTAGAEIYLGPEGTLMGTIEQIQSAGFVELRASF